MCSGSEWREDSLWSSILDEGWDLGAVRSVAQKIMDKENDALNWLDYGNEHPHRIALSARMDKLDQIVKSLEEGFENEEVEVHR